MKLHELDKEKDGFQCMLEILSNRKGLILLGTLTIFSIACIGAYFMPPAYETFATVLVQQEQLVLNKEYMSPLSTDTFLGSQRVIITSRQILGEVVKSLRLDKENKPQSFFKKILNKYFKIYPDPFEEAVRKLQKKIKVDQTGVANIISINIQLDDPFQAALVVNTVANVYTDYITKMRLAKAQNNSDFIAQQVENAKKKLIESEEALKNFKENEKIVTFKETTSNILEGSAAVENQYLDIKIKIQDLEDQLVLAKKFFADGKWEEIFSNRLIDSRKAEALRAEFEQLESDLSIISAQYSPDYVKNDPKASLVLEKLNKTKEKLIEEIGDNLIFLEKQLNSLKDKEKFLLNIIADYNVERKKVTEKELELARLTRDVKINEEMYLMLLKKLEGTRVSEITEKWNMGGVKIIDRAFPPPYPLRRKRALLPFIGFFIGLIFGIAMAFFAEYRDNTLKTPHEVEHYFNLDILGIVPLTSRKYRKLFSGF